MTREGLMRLKKEYKLMIQDPLPNAIAVPNPNNWFKWHFAIYNLPSDTPYHGGVYHGELRFPNNYPMGPPSIIMHTTSARFEPGKKICTSMSDYHPETWSPIWRISSIIQGLISFMLSDEITTGAIRSTDAAKR